MSQSFPLRLRVGNLTLPKFQGHPFMTQCLLLERRTTGRIRAPHTPAGEEKPDERLAADASPSCPGHRVAKECPSHALKAPTLRRVSGPRSKEPQQAQHRRPK